MKVKLLDTKTGQTRIVNNEVLNEWDWIEGNWSCDCNRQKYFENNEDKDICIGSKRYIIIEVYYDGIYTLRDFNCNYSDKLLDKYLK